MLEQHSQERHPRVPFSFLRMDIFVQQLINGVPLGAIYAVVPLGYTMVYGIIQLINFAHGEVVMVGAMVAYSVIGALMPAGLPPLAVVFIAAGCAIPACMLIGYAMERVAYRPLRGAPRLAPLITAIGISIILQHVAMLIWSRNPLAFPQVVKVESYSIGGATITSVQIAIIAISVLLMAGLWLLVLPTQLRTPMRAPPHRPTPPGRGADGHTRKPHLRAGLRHRRPPRCRRGGLGAELLRHRPLHHGAAPRAESVLRGGAGRHRQCPQFGRSHV